MKKLILVTGILLANFAGATLTETMKVNLKFSAARCQESNDYETCGPYGHLTGTVVIPLTKCETQSREEYSCSGTWTTKIAAGDKNFIAEITATLNSRSKDDRDYTIDAALRPEWDKNTKPNTVTIKANQEKMPEPVTTSLKVKGEVIDKTQISYFSELTLSLD